MEFWKINKAIGMTEMDIVKINNLLVEIIIVISLLFGTILACYLSQHFVLYIEDLFELEGLQCRLSGSSVVGLYLACNLLFILGKCIKIRKKENKSVGKNL